MIVPMPSVSAAARPAPFPAFTSTPFYCYCPSAVL
ncbi:MAG: hypothetical protein BWY52_00180 [Chloroflexi bacterium ADurb.Bin325]|nr:MAG: hypothetical protein BWY52_00180 [Chloroflexi bacterium ADurb.Bin325]